MGLFGIGTLGVRVFGLVVASVLVRVGAFRVMVVMLSFSHDLNKLKLRPNNQISEELGLV